MKNTILYSISIALFVLVSCAKTKGKDNNLLSNAWKKDIVLNNGVKWEANQETTNGLFLIYNIIINHNSTEVVGYKYLGDQLKEESNQIIKNCTMKGAAHDNLHVFLLPLIEKIDEFQNVTSVDYGNELKKSILSHIDAYDTYFD